MMPGKDSVLKFRSTEYRCCLVTSHEHNSLSFSIPQSYVLLSAESKATQAANNKDMLDECHDIVWCHTIKNPDGSGVWPGEVLHGDHQLMRPARFAAKPLKYTREGLRKDHL